MREKIMLSNIASELRSRSEARKMFEKYRSITSPTVEIEIDFSGVVLISRSFADELCEIIDSLSNKVIMVNKSLNIDLTMKIVRKNRNTQRTYSLNGDVREYSDVESLTEFLCHF